MYTLDHFFLHGPCCGPSFLSRPQAGPEGGREDSKLNGKGCSLSRLGIQIKYSGLTHGVHDETLLVLAGSFGIDPREVRIK